MATLANDESSAPRLEPGREVAGRFVLDRLLGEGGMGWVWAAAEKETGRRVALKVLKGGREEDRRRFLREVRAVAAIRHPNVVRIDEVLELELSPDDKTMVMVVELLEGETLGEVIRREGRLGLARLSEILLQITSALEAAHAAGIVHRDLKPDNVFLAKDGVRVLDFGVAKLTASEGLAARTQALTGTGSMIGTPYYMSPEQVESEKDLDAGSDVWSLGVMTYECLSGTRPTEAETVGRVLKRILMADFEPIERRCPDVPADVARLVGAMLTSDRAARLQDLGELRRVLAPYAAGVIPASRPAAVASSSHPAPAPAPADPLARTERADSADARSDTHGAVAVGPPPRRSRARLYGAVAAVAAALSGITFAARSPSSPAPASLVPAPASAPDPSVSPATSRPPPEPVPTASSAPSASPSSSAAVRPVPPSATSAAPRCAANETLSRGHCCARGLAWDGTRCERPLATSFE